MKEIFFHEVSKKWTYFFKKDCVEPSMKTNNSAYHVEIIALKIVRNQVVIICLGIAHPVLVY